MDHDGRMVQVALAASEVEIIAKQFVAGLGRAEDWDPEEFDCVVSVIPAFKFPIFLAVLESKYAVDQDPLTLVEAVRELLTVYPDAARAGDEDGKLPLLSAVQL